jgi:hypothetical protein
VGVLLLLLYGVECGLVVVVGGECGCGVIVVLRRWVCCCFRGDCGCFVVVVVVNVVVNNKLCNIFRTLNYISKHDTYNFL